MKDWNLLVKKHWDHWQYYKEMINYSLQKSANSPFTSWLYPFFYQERLLKKVFVENMQLLGDLTDEECHQFETLVGGLLYRYTYKYYKYPEGGWMNLYHISMFTCGAIVGREAYIGRRPKKWWVLAPLAFVFGVSALWQRILIKHFGILINVTQWAIEKRKAEVWRAQQIIQVPPLKNIQELMCRVSALILDEKISMINL